MGKGQVVRDQRPQRREVGCRAGAFETHQLLTRRRIWQEVKTVTQSVDRVGNLVHLSAATEALQEDDLLSQLGLDDAPSKVERLRRV